MKYIQQNILSLELDFFSGSKPANFQYDSKLLCLPRPCEYDAGIAGFSNPNMRLTLRIV